MTIRTAVLLPTVLAAFIGCAHVQTHPPWPADVKAERVARCTSFITAEMGATPEQAAVYCPCMLNEYERQRPVEWLDADDTEEDKAMMRAANTMCLLRTLDEAAASDPEAKTEL